MPKYSIMVKGTVDFVIEDIVADDLESACEVVKAGSELMKHLRKPKTTFNDYALEVYGVYKD